MKLVSYFDEWYGRTVIADAETKTILFQATEEGSDYADRIDPEGRMEILGKQIVGAANFGLDHADEAALWWINAQDIESIDLNPVSLTGNDYESIASFIRDNDDLYFFMRETLREAVKKLFPDLPELEDLP